MQHLLIALAVLSFSLSVAALVLCLLIFSATRSPLSKDLAVLQGLIAYAVFYFFSVSYLRFAAAAPPLVIVAWHGVGQLWSGAFCYQYCLFFFRLTGVEALERRRKLLATACAAFGATVVAPFLPGLDAEGLAARINFQNSFIVLPFILAATLLASATELVALRRAAAGRARTIVRIDLGAKAVLVPAIVAATAFEARHPEFWDLWKFLLSQAYFLLWSVASMVLAVRYLRSMGSVSGNPARKAASAQDGSPADPLSPAELERLRRAMREEKAYLDPELTLTALAERLGIPRNRLSRLINEGLGKSYNDFVNEYRVEEAKALLSSPGAEVLGAAFESGFNSKATFYAAFKRATGMAPSEFRASLARPEG